MAKSSTMVGVSDDDTNIKVKELKKELHKFVSGIIQDDDGDDVEEETFDKAIQALTALKELKLNKKNNKNINININNNNKKKKKLSLSLSSSSSSNFDDLNVPEEFRCPISKEIMKDPVVLSTGQTYDRPFIQKWLKEGNRTCPQTQQVLSHIELTPNHLVRELIAQWCKDHGTELPPPLQDINNGFVTEADRNHLNALLEKMSLTLSEQKEAAKEIRMLTRRMPSFRSFFGESTDALPQLLSPLTTSGSLEDHPELQEDLITTILNLSIHDNNKKLIADHPCVIPLLVESLTCGTIETRTNAAAALFTLSALDENKLLIGESGALKPLIDLLKEGHESAMKDVASAIFNLCKIKENRGKAVRDGAVKVILEKITKRVHVSELLAILAILATHHKAVEQLEELRSVGCFLSIIRESTSEPDRENCIVIVHEICSYSHFSRRDVKEDEKANGTISQLAENGTTRAKRKANGLLSRLRLNRHINYTHTA